MSIKNLDELKARVNIVEVIKNFMPLKQIHGSYKGLCPFHSEKTPSFSVSEQKGFFKCFGCGEGGDAFAFVQKFKHYDFNEAVREIADIYNFELEFSGEKATPKKDYFEFYARLNTHFKENLLKNEKLLNYLAKRGLNKDDLNYYDIGLVPNNYELIEFIGKDRELALATGLLVQGQNGLYSQFAKRLSFALKNTIFKIVGFSCRIHDYENFSKQSKYINSRESFLFHKSNFLYNLNFAKPAYFKKPCENEPKPLKKLVIVEGFMDSIALSKLGHKANVASCGTAFNQVHLATLLKAEIDNFALCFDKDEVGLKATLKTCELLFKHGFFESEVWVLRGDFKDLGEVMQNAQGSQQGDFNALFEKFNAFEFYVLKTLESKESARDKDKFLKALLKSIHAQKNFFLKNFCLERLEKITGFEFKASPRQNLQSVNFDAEKVLFKSILSDEKCKIIANELLHSAYFENFKESFLAFKERGEKDELAQSLLFDESVQVVKGLDFDELCKSFKRAFLSKELEKAKIARNYDLICSLQGQIQKLDEVASVF